MTAADRHDSPLWSLVVQLAMLSMTAIGGGVVMLAPDVHRFVVEAHPWISDQQFAAAFAIAQAAPGPNMLYVTLIGWQIAGIAGAALATLAVVVLPATLLLVLLRLGDRRSPGPLGRTIRRGIAPLSVGMLLAAGWILARTSDTDWRSGLITAATVLIMLRARINPIWLIGAGALIGIAGYV